jgi:hypothetical protein
LFYLILYSEGEYKNLLLTNLNHRFSMVLGMEWRSALFVDRA